MVPRKIVTRIYVAEMCMFDVTQGLQQGCVLSFLPYHVIFRPSPTLRYGTLLSSPNFEPSSSICPRPFLRSISEIWHECALNPCQKVEDVGLGGWDGVGRYIVLA